MSVDDIWKSETSFWLDGPAFYARFMVAEARMVFPAPVGILKGKEIPESLEGAPRWEAVEMKEKSALQLGATVVLVYRATGRRGGTSAYSALCSSTYVREDGQWKLLAHQQTPVT
ncbi:DUF4440 domain-containing protein [Plastorhodobacter daqingensis]|uniref:DUF4440 domain-containing protein n=1 Tax=Plastorhodobacter daqingensis TaxID=1387281 RepID=A0ABW2UIV2_9RHOB